MEKTAQTPLMKQYNHFKSLHPEAILLFRVGDFYETYGDDAIKSAKTLGITLTKHGKGDKQTELAGFPYHALDTYLPKLVRAGFRVAICEQLEDPKQTKTLVKRGITELVTPGVSVNDKVLEQGENNFLAALQITEKQTGIAFIDISTGEFYIAEGNDEYINKLFQNFKPMEVVLQRNKTKTFNERFNEKILQTRLDDWVFSSEFANETLTKHFQTNSLKGFGVEDLKLGIIAAGAALHYIYETQNHKVQHITKISRIDEDIYLWLDKFTIRNLELTLTPNENAITLLQVLDKTLTPMGSRMLRKWILMPLKEKKLIEERLSIVEFMIQHSDFSMNLSKSFKTMGDLERLVSKIAVGKINPRELLILAASLRSIETIKELCDNTNHKSLSFISEQLNPCISVCKEIEKDINLECPVVVAKGGIFNKGVNEELDELNNLATNSRSVLSDIQQREAERTGINSLKIGFNNVFGYYLEVSNIHKAKVPPEWIRKQTLTGSERYITEELKSLETKILNAQSRIIEIETQLFNNLVLSLTDFIPIIQNNARIAARLDVLLTFAKCATEYNYVKPVVNNGDTIDIHQGRHPVIERQMPPGEQYIPNDVYLDNNNQQIIVITGPNMSGKSALLRQTALITLMAQMGSYVPATECTIGITDKIFTRVGASDNITTGESTFMVEMNETANILNNVTNKSLVLLDEIGRGTSTYDGISIAWSITEYLHENPQHHAKVMFATHYHELNDMASQFPRIKNYHVSVKEIDNKIFFLRKLEPGGSEHSFGIHVARMAGMPTWVLKRAEEILKQLENNRANEAETPKKQNNGYQLSFIALDDPLLLDVKEKIIGLDINSLTPVEALMKLNEIQNLLTKKK